MGVHYVIFKYTFKVHGKTWVIKNLEIQFNSIILYAILSINYHNSCFLLSYDIFIIII